MCSYQVCDPKAIHVRDLGTLVHKCWEFYKMVYLTKSPPDTGSRLCAVKLSSPFGLLLRWGAWCFKILTKNIFHNLCKYISQFMQIYFTIYANIFHNLCKYILNFTDMFWNCTDMFWNCTDMFWNCTDVFYK